MKYLEDFESWALLEKERSMINYYGSKYSMMDTLNKYFPDKASMFIDLFTGGANVAINVKYSRKIANDVNEDLINLYLYVQKTPFKTIIKRIDYFVKKYGLIDVNPEGFNRLKMDHYKDRDPVKVYILTSLSYFGVMRFNNTGIFNKGYSHKPFNRKLIFTKLKSFKNSIKRIKFTNKSFTKINPPKNAFVYADPPYLITKADYNKHWTPNDEVKLLDYLDKLDKKGVKWALSNVFTHKGRANDLLIKWAKKYKVIKLDKKYSIAKGDVENTQEVLVINYKL